MSFETEEKQTTVRFGNYGGRYVPETLMPAINELQEAFEELAQNEAFIEELNGHLRNYAGRPTPIYYAKQLSQYYDTDIYLKREDLLHTGAHKLNNALGQALLAKHMGKHRIIAETGAGQHGVATAAACAKLGMDCDVYMGEVDMQRQQPNVFRMRLAGTNVIPVSTGTATLKDAINEALRDWTANVETSHYLLGSVLGPAPYPEMVAHFQSIIGTEARKQFLEQVGTRPDGVIACVGGGSNAIGIFRGFLDDEDVTLVGVEAGGEGISSGKHAARFQDTENGREGILHGTFTYVLQDQDGQISNTHSISAGLDYSAVGPEHVRLRDRGRASYTSATDEEALEAFRLLSRKEGIIPALESAHAVAHIPKYLEQHPDADTLLINLSGRGDKDLDTVMEQFGEDLS